MSEEELDKKFMEAVGEAMKKPELAGMQRLQHYSVRMIRRINMGETKSTDYIPENANEEYALLVGRLKAFEAWANSVKDYDFTKNIAFRMLGLDVEEAKEEKKE